LLAIYHVTKYQIEQAIQKNMTKDNFPFTDNKVNNWYSITDYTLICYKNSEFWLLPV
jgi:hypothetical protein